MQQTARNPKHLRFVQVGAQSGDASGTCPDILIAKTLIRWQETCCCWFWLLSLSSVLEKILGLLKGHKQTPRRLLNLASDIFFLLFEFPSPAALPLQLQLSGITQPMKRQFLQAKHWSAAQCSYISWCVSFCYNTINVLESTAVGLTF